MFNEDFDLERMAEHIYNKFCQTKEFNKTFAEFRFSDPIGFEEFMTEITIAFGKGFN